MSKDAIHYISITDIARQKNATDPNGVIANWMRNRNTVEFLSIRETLHTPNPKGSCSAHTHLKKFPIATF